MGSTQQVVQQLHTSVNTFDQRMDNELVKVDQAAYEIDVSTKKIYNKVEAFKTTMKNNETKQIAFENTIRIDQQLEEKLRFYNDVRRVVMGVVHDYDVNLVRNKTINELSEELWMGASKYWLSYALIAISAWIMDNQELANNALSMGMKQDPVNFSLFFALFNMRFGRMKTSNKWLVTYFSQVDPKEPGNELAVLLQAYISGAFGKDPVLETVVRKNIEKWQRELNEDPVVSDDLTKGYYKYISEKKGKKQFTSEILDEFCTNIKDFKSAYEDVSKYEVLYKEMNDIVNASSPSNGGEFKKLIDSLMTQLINLPDEEEQKLLDDKKYNELIIESEGKIEVAEKLYKQYLETRGEIQNIGRTMLRWVLFSNEKEVTPQVKKFSLYQTKSWYTEGIQKLRSEQSLRRPHVFNLSIDIWSGVVDGSDRKGVEKSLEETLNTDKISSTVFHLGNIIGVIVAIVLALIAIPVLKANTWVGIAMFVFAGVTLFVIAMITIVAMGQYPKRVAKAKLILDKCFDDIERYNKEYDSFEKMGSKLSVDLYNITI